jgi:hypothetical protein
LAISPPPMIVLPPLIILLGLNFWAPLIKANVFLF